MRRIITSIACAVALSGCATGSVPSLSMPSASTLATNIAEGQLLCQVGAEVKAMQAATPAGVSPILAKGATASAVNQACALVSGVAVSPPAAGVAGSVTVALPPSITIPLKA